VSTAHVFGAATVVAGVDANAPGYDLVLLAHVLTAVVGLVAVGIAGGCALALRRALVTGGPVPEALARYYRPGINWAGRVLFLVPVLGIALLAMSGGQWSFADGWVSMGMAVWAAVAIAAESVLWPAERRLQEVVAARGTGDGQDPGPVDGAGGLHEVTGLCLRTGAMGLALAAALVVVAVVMVAKP
jgi:uncharacterized membrane protein